MKTLRNFAVLAILCLAVAACGSVKKSHEMDVKWTETDLMKYNSVAQGVNKDGQVGLQLSLIGQSKVPSQTITTQQVPVTVMAGAPAPPPRPVYGRAAKAVPRTPPVSPPVAKTEIRTVVTTETTYRGPEVLATVGGGGPSTGHSVAANIPGAIGSVGSAAVGGYFFKEGMRVLRPAQEQTTNTTKVSTPVNVKQGQSTRNNNKLLGINKNITGVDVNATGTGIGTGIGTGTGTADSN